MRLAWHSGSNQDAIGFSSAQDSQSSSFNKIQIGADGNHYYPNQRPFFLLHHQLPVLETCLQSSLTGISFLFLDSKSGYTMPWILLSLEVENLGYSERYSTEQGRSLSLMGVRF